MVMLLDGDGDDVVSRPLDNLYLAFYDDNLAQPPDNRDTGYSNVLEMVKVMVMMMTKMKSSPPLPC